MEEEEEEDDDDDDHKVLNGKHTQRKRSFRKPNYRWADSIKIKCNFLLQNLSILLLNVNNRLRMTRRKAMDFKTMYKSTYKFCFS